MVAIGIDLGTMTSSVGVYEKGDGVKVLARLPSYAAVNKVGEEGVVLAEEAQQVAKKDARRALFDAKVLAGRELSDPVVRQGSAHWPFTVAATKAGSVTLAAGTQAFLPEELLALTIRQLLRAARDQLQDPITKITCTVPTTWTPPQLQALRSACFLADIPCEPLKNCAAGVLSYLYQGGPCTKGNVLFVDVGHGSYEVNLMKLDEDGTEVLASDGEAHFGGRIIDQKLADYVRAAFEAGDTRVVKSKLANNTTSLHRLREACEAAKVDLSTKQTVDVWVPFFHDEKDLVIDVTRSELEELCTDLRARISRSISKVTANHTVNDVVLLGGMTNMPCIKALVADYGDSPSASRPTHSIDSLVCGASLRAIISRTPPLKRKASTDASPGPKQKRAKAAPQQSSSAPAPATPSSKKRPRDSSEPQPTAAKRPAAKKGGKRKRGESSADPNADDPTDNAPAKPTVLACPKCGTTTTKGGKRFSSVAGLGSHIARCKK